MDIIKTEEDYNYHFRKMIIVREFIEPTGKRKVSFTSKEPIREEEKDQLFPIRIELAKVTNWCSTLIEVNDNMTEGVTFYVESEFLTCVQAVIMGFEEFDLMMMNYKIGKKIN